jgi:cyclic pyranopterin phosphate synthase
MKRESKIPQIGSGGARMVDVGDKNISRREAVAEAFVSMSPGTLELISSGKVPKGDVLSVARIGGIMGAKKTHELIPLCHPVKIDAVSIDFEVEESSGIRVISKVTGTDRTGVEMEALTGAAIAALTIYDMCKAVERSAEIRGLRLLEKRGGKSGDYKRS